MGDDLQRAGSRKNKQTRASFSFTDVKPAPKKHARHSWARFISRLLFVTLTLDMLDEVINTVQLSSLILHQKLATKEASQAVATVDGLCGCGRRERERGRETETKHSFARGWLQFSVVQKTNIHIRTNISVNL